MWVKRDKKIIKQIKQIKNTALNLLLVAFTAATVSTSAMAAHELESARINVESIKSKSIWDGVCLLHPTTCRHLVVEDHSKSRTNNNN